MTYSPVYISPADIYARTGLSTAEIDFTVGSNMDIIEDSEKEIEIITGRKWTGSNSITEIQDAPNPDILGYNGGQLANAINLRNYPVQSITSFIILNTDGSTNTTFANLVDASISAGTFDTADYWLETMTDPLTLAQIATGRVHMTNQLFSSGVSSIKISYTYGYSSVPTQIRTLVSCEAGIRAWIAFLGGQYDRRNSYTIPDVSESKGDFYDRGLKIIQQLTEEKERLLDRVGRRSRTLFVASNAYR